MTTPRKGFASPWRLSVASLSARAGARLLAATVIPVAVAAMLFASTTSASTGQRVALVIGNASYQHVPVLANPLNDAADIGATLGRLGFTVTIVENAGRAELWKGLQEFALAASASEMAVVFYAGHGIEVDKRNFLVPVDARLKSDADIEFETVPLELVSRAVERARGFRLIILDACRDNPFTVAMQRAGAARSIGRGLAPVEPSGGTLVAYAAKEGTVAADGKGRNSPYTSALLAHLEEPGLEVNLLFRRVRDAVVAATGGRQIPFTYGSLSSQAIYLSALPEAEPEPERTPVPATARSGADSETPDVNQIVERRIAAEKELVFWESVKDSTHTADFEAYLEQFSGGTYEVLARNRLARLKVMHEQESAARVATPDEPEPVSSPDPPAPAPESVEASLGLQRGERRQIQIGLAALGFDPGPADGLFGRRTRIAIQEWQASVGEPVTGYLDSEVAKRLVEARDEAPQSEERQATLPQAEEASASAAPLKPFGPNWIVVENQRCQVYNPYPEPAEAVTWTGACRDHKASGFGQLVWRNRHGESVYQGNFLAGKATGQGTLVWPNGDRYEGELRDSKLDGSGVLIWSDGRRYEGVWRADRQHGQGTLTWPGDGRYEGIDGRYEGEWRDDKRHGTGTQTWPAGDRYNGEWHDDKRHGSGKQSWPNDSRYIGAWRDDKPHGHGTLMLANGEFYRGQWRNGCFKGPNGSWAFAATTKEACGFR